MALVSLTLESVNPKLLQPSSMESSSSESLPSLSFYDYFNFLLLRPFLAISFALTFLSVGWFLAWKLVLVHVPLVQEVFGLRKKLVKPKPPLRRRLSRLYSSIDSQNSASGGENDLLSKRK